MAAVAASTYSSHHHHFVSHSSASSSSQQQQQQRHALQQEQDVLDDQLTTLFCRALYDYQAQDASALSFRRNDIIEVLTQQPSGWWDGLLGDERGWFPSNYVTVISDEEAEAAFSGSDFSAVDSSFNDNQGDPAMLDMSTALMRGSQADNEEWLDSEMLASAVSNTNSHHGGPSQPSDFWVPRVTATGQIYFVNTQTGQQALDLPREMEDEVSDGELAGLTSQSSSRSGTSAGLGFASNGGIDLGTNGHDIAGFGLARRSGTPEPWVKKLADDGRSWYYFNKQDGSVQWTRPEPPLQEAVKSNLLAPPTNGASKKRLSVYSDDSDVQPTDNPRRLADNTGRSKWARDDSPTPEDRAAMELTSAEKLAQSLQTSLAPPPPPPVTEFSALAKASIQDVVENIQTNGVKRGLAEDNKLDGLIYLVVEAVRNLLYVSSGPSGQLPALDTTKSSSSSSQSPLKPAQRKVTATLSRLVLSARAMQYDSGSSMSDTLNRIEVDAEELERAVLAFVLEVQRLQHTAIPNAPQSKPIKRLHGIFTTANVGLGLVGAGAAAGWKGFGWVALDDETQPARTVLGAEVLSELGNYMSRLQTTFTSLGHAVRISDESSVEQVRLRGQDLLSQLSTVLNFVADIHIARHVDIDGIREDGVPTSSELYLQTVEKARVHIRTLEAAMQSLYDDSMALLTATQLVRDPEVGQPVVERDTIYDHIDVIATSLKANVAVVQQTLDTILALGHDQAEMAQGDYNGSIEWRMSRLSVIDNQFGGAIRPRSIGDSYDDEEVVDIDFAFARQPSKSHLPGGDQAYLSSYRNMANDSEVTYNDSGRASVPEYESATEETVYASDSPEFGEERNGNGGDVDHLDEDDFFVNKPVKKRPLKKNLANVLGAEYPSGLTAPPPPPVPEVEPWYRQPAYSPTEILVEPDKSVRGGTVPALVERLTAHEQGDPTFIKAFLMTFKSFTTLDELFDLLVARFRIQPPEGLTPAELDDWAKHKQSVIQFRVINTFRSMIVDDDVLEREDMYILDRMKEFISTEEVSRIAAAKQLLTLIERARSGGGAIPKTMATLAPPPPPIMPKTSKKLKLLDIEPLELARQLTIMESQLYQKIRPMECLQRAREQKTETIDNITVVIQTSNKIANWVAECVLSKEDSRRRAAAVKHLISVADRCRTLNNFSTMIAITSGLNTPPIRRLKRTWEQVNQRFMAQFGACEMTIDSNKNFTKYRQLMASVTPPCVPFIGIFLSTLQFIQDGNPDMLPPGNLVNFRKRQKASEVINDIKRWQAQPFNLQIIPSIQAYIDEALTQDPDARALSERFWTLSLEREPREREDEKMARLLQESGFL